MNLHDSLFHDKISCLALLKIALDAADELEIDIDPDKPLQMLCEDLHVNRSSVYNRKKQLETALKNNELPERGRPKAVEVYTHRQEQDLTERVLRYRLEHPGAYVVHDSGRVGYSDGFIRFILDQFDEWPGTSEEFCRLVEVPYQSLIVWRRRDKEDPYQAHTPRPIPEMADSASRDCRQVAEDYASWEGSLRDFLKHETARTGIGPTAIRRILNIFKMVPIRSRETEIRYRGSTEELQPGTMLVTDGKELQIVLTSTGEVKVYNWQGIVDQATGCHTAVVITDTECAQGVLDAFRRSCEFLGHPPEALLHDNKPIYDDQQLREEIEKTTVMIPATPGRGQNKAVMEGTFGKNAQEIGTIHLDNSSEENLIRSAIREIFRAYTAGTDHAERAQFNGRSRISVLRDHCPDPKKDQEFIEKLHADHTRKRVTEILPTKLVTRVLLDEAFKQFDLERLDSEGKTRGWLAGRYTPQAVSQALAIFATEWEKGRLQNDMAHRYLVKVIQNCQDEIDLRRQEELLLEYAEKQRLTWLAQLEDESGKLLEGQLDNERSKAVVFTLAEKAVFGGLPFQRAFWEKKLYRFLETVPQFFKAVRNHVRRLYEADREDRFTLISKLCDWEVAIAEPIGS